MPPALANRPELSNSTQFYYEVFSDLSSSRLYGQNGPQPLQFSEVMAYLDEIFVTHDRMTWWRLIHTCDMCYLRLSADKTKADLDKLKKK